MNAVRLSLAHSLLAMALTGTILFAASPAAAEPNHGAGSQAAVPKPATGNFEQRFIRELRSNGMEVSVGYPRVYTQADCAFSYPVFHNCFGNNPAAPYVMPVVESWPDEYVDPAMKNGFGRTRPGYSATYRLDPREAIILFGRMPPRARYMGLQTWIFSTGWARERSPWDQEACFKYKSFAHEMTQYFFATFPPGSTDPHCLFVPRTRDRVQSFASIDNNINNVLMEKQSGPPWDEMRYWVITPDRRTDAAVREALMSLGVDEDEIFTEAIPAHLPGSRSRPSLSLRSESRRRPAGPGRRCGRLHDGGPLRHAGGRAGRQRLAEEPPADCPAGPQAFRGARPRAIRGPHRGRSAHGGRGH